MLCYDDIAWEDTKETVSSDAVVLCTCALYLV